MKFINPCNKCIVTTTCSKFNDDEKRECSIYKDYKKTTLSIKICMVVFIVLSIIIGVVLLLHEENPKDNEIWVDMGHGGNPYLSDSDKNYILGCENNFVLWKNLGDPNISWSTNVGTFKKEYDKYTYIKNE